MVPEQGERREVDPPGAVCQHLPLVEGKEKEKKRRGHRRRDPAADAVASRHRRREREKEGAEHHVKHGAVVKERHIHDPLRIVRRNPRQDVRMQVGREARDVPEVGVHEADVVRVDDIDRRAPDIGREKEKAEERQKIRCDFSSHGPSPFSESCSCHCDYSRDLLRGKVHDHREPVGSALLKRIFHVKVC